VHGTCGAPDAVFDTPARIAAFLRPLLLEPAR
jgi:hypothetical protein